MASVYQIDFSAVAAGKRVAATKRRVRWRFGYPNREAIEQGLSGTDCRGEEHEVTIVWSVTSGKRQILMDGKEILYQASRTGIIDHSWSTVGNHVMKVLCHAAPPLNPMPGFRQYDLSIDGQSFFTFPKVYELGVGGRGAAGTPRSAPSGPRRSPIPVPHSAQEEEADLQRAINASLEESRRHLEKKNMLENGNGNQGGGDLLGFVAPAPTPDTMSYMSSPTAGGSAYGAPPPPQQQPYAALPPSTSYGSPPPQQPPQQQLAALPPSTNVPPPNYVQSAPVPAPYVDPFAPKPVDAATEILGFYPAPTPTTSNAAGNPPPFGSPQSNYSAPTQYNAPPQQQMAPYGSPPPQQASPYGAPPPAAAPYVPPPPQSVPYGVPPPAAVPQPEATPAGPQLTMNALTNTEEEKKDSDPYSAALKKLVNVNNIDMPADGAFSMSIAEDEKKSKSGALPPVNTNSVGASASLKDIASSKQARQPNKEVMKAPPQLFSPNAAMAGALVVHDMSGPPPLNPQGLPPEGMGFGVGYQMQQQKMMIQQQQQQMHQQGGPPMYGAPPQQYQYR